MQPLWSGDSTGFAFITQSKDGKLFNKIDLEKMQVEPLFDQQRVASLLYRFIKKTVQSNDLPLDDLKYIDKTSSPLPQQEKITCLI